jgi:hypothetical protein
MHPAGIVYRKFVRARSIRRGGRGHGSQLGDGAVRQGGLGGGLRVRMMEVLARLKGVERSGAGDIAICPIHNRAQDLQVSWGPTGGIRLRCREGCTEDQVARAIGLTPADLLGAHESGSEGDAPAQQPSGSSRGAQRRSVVTGGDLVREKAKGIGARQRHPDEEGTRSNEATGSQPSDKSTSQSRSAGPSAPKVVANPDNVLESAGPKPPASKQPARRNPLRHRMYADDLVIPGVDGPNVKPEFTRLRDPERRHDGPTDVKSEFDVEGPVGGQRTPETSDGKGDSMTESPHEPTSAPAPGEDGSQPEYTATSSKRPSQRPALHPGGFAPAPVVPEFEDPEEWEAHWVSVVTALRPVGHLELQGARRIAELEWRLHRVAAYECGAISQELEKTDAALEAQISKWPGGSGVVRRSIQHEFVTRDLAVEGFGVLVQLGTLSPEQPVDRRVACWILFVAATEAGGLSLQDITVPTISHGKRVEDVRAWTVKMVAEGIEAIAKRAGKEPGAVTESAIQGFLRLVEVTGAKGMILEELLQRLRPRFVLPDRGTRDGIAHYEQHLRRELEAALRYFRALQTARLRWLGPLARWSLAPFAGG